MAEKLMTDGGDTESSVKLVRGFLLDEDEVLVWDSEATNTLRTQHHVMGSLVGALPTHPRQNNVPGLPLLLMPEETTLLVEEGILSVFQYSSPFGGCDHTSLQLLLKETREHDAIKQFQDYQKHRQAATAARNLRSALSPTVTTSSSSPSSQQSTVSSFPPSFSPQICLHTADPSDVSDISGHILVKWAWPNTDSEKLRYAVFKDLWRRDYYITSGLKYGGDYLVYPGDPAIVHSHYIAIVSPWTKEFPTSQLVGLSRLGTKVKKNTLLCSVDPADGQVTYHTLQWTGWS